MSPSVAWNKRRVAQRLPAAHTPSGSLRFGEKVGTGNKAENSGCGGVTRLTFSAEQAQSFQNDKNNRLSCGKFSFSSSAEVIFVPFLSLRMRWIQNTGQLIETQRHINVSNYIFHPCVVSLASKGALLVFCLWPSRAITHGGPSSHSSALSAPLFTAAFPGSDGLNLPRSCLWDL